MQYICLQCGDNFKAAPAANRKFCSRLCFKNYEARDPIGCSGYEKHIIRICPICKFVFKARGSKIAKGKGIYCNKVCANIAHSKRMVGINNPSYTHGQSKTREYLRCIDAQQRTKRKKAKGRHNSEDIKKLYCQQKGKCLICKKELGDKYQVDHITPLSRGGSNWPNNLQLLCKSCNCKKGAKHPLEFLVSQGILTP